MFLIDFVRITRIAFNILISLFLSKFVFSTVINCGCDHLKHVSDKIIKFYLNKNAHIKTKIFNRKGPRSLHEFGWKRGKAPAMTIQAPLSKYKFTLLYYF